MYLGYVGICKVILDKISVIHRLEIINLSPYMLFLRDVSDWYTKQGKDFKIV